jgi:hypothetical protein
LLLRAESRWRFLGGLSASFLLLRIDAAAVVVVAAPQALLL